MNIERDALLRVVKATRMSMKLADGLSEVLVGNGFTVVDDIAGFLADALFKISGEQLQSGMDFDKDSNTMQILKSDMDDGAVTDWFFMLDSIRRIHLRHTEEEARQPAPHVIAKEDLDELYSKNGGYRFNAQDGTYKETPEGE